MSLSGKGPQARTGTTSRNDDPEPRDFANAKRKLSERIVAQLRGGVDAGRNNKCGDGARCEERGLGAELGAPGRRRLETRRSEPRSILVLQMSLVILKEGVG